MSDGASIKMLEDCVYVMNNEKKGWMDNRSVEFNLNVPEWQ